MAMNENFIKNPFRCELSEDELEAVVGGFAEGDQVVFKSGRIHCTECGLRNITGSIYAGKGNVRLALLTLPCRHQTYASERAIELAE